MTSMRLNLEHYTSSLERQISVYEYENKLLKSKLRIQYEEDQVKRTKDKDGNGLEFQQGEAISSLTEIANKAEEDLKLEVQRSKTGDQKKRALEAKNAEIVEALKCSKRAILSLEEEITNLKDFRKKSELRAKMLARRRSAVISGLSGDNAKLREELEKSKLMVSNVEERVARVRSASEYEISQLRIRLTEVTRSYDNLRRNNGAEGNENSSIDEDKKKIMELEDSLASMRGWHDSLAKSLDNAEKRTRQYKAIADENTKSLEKTTLDFDKERNDIIKAHTLELNGKAEQLKLALDQKDEIILSITQNLESLQKSDQGKSDRILDLECKIDLHKEREQALQSEKEKLQEQVQAAEIAAETAKEEAQTQSKTMEAELRALRIKSEQLLAEKSVETQQKLCKKRMETELIVKKERKTSAEKLSKQRRESETLILEKENAIAKMLDAELQKQDENSSLKCEIEEMTETLQNLQSNNGNMGETISSLESENEILREKQVLANEDKANIQKKVSDLQEILQATRDAEDNRIREAAARQIQNVSRMYRAWRKLFYLRIEKGKKTAIQEILNDLVTQVEAQTANIKVDVKIVRKVASAGKVLKAKQGESVKERFSAAVWRGELCKHFYKKRTFKDKCKMCELPKSAHRCVEYVKNSGICSAGTSCIFMHDTMEDIIRERKQNEGSRKQRITIAKSGMNILIHEEVPTPIPEKLVQVNGVRRFRIQALSARDLIASDSNGLSDPYCKFCVIDGSNNIIAAQKTSIIKETLNPKWCSLHEKQSWLQCEHEISPEDSANNWTLCFHVKDDDAIGGNQELGTLKIDYNEIMRHESGWYDLQPTPRMKASAEKPYEHGDLGQIHVGFAFMEDKKPTEMAADTALDQNIIRQVSVQEVNRSNFDSLLHMSQKRTSLKMSKVHSVSSIASKNKPANFTTQTRQNSL